MILFLDFDGVLHPIGSQKSAYFCCVPLLERFLVDDAPGWRIVISSSWREYFPIEELKQRLGPALGSRVDGHTPWSDDKRLSGTWGAQASLYPREIEIRHYLAQHQLDAQNWVALDDHADWFRDPKSNPHLVLTKPQVGLNANTIERLRNLKLQGLSATQL